ncbi:hypothetical protein [Pseudomonas sp. MWU12-2323]|uniref:hypothetical protein n=1 Tax=Pseudomonas sp. MWU12-2323 TaxID=2651296 RepID=UPI00128D4FA0|nr:hypothetical protein [Pseudomonas sp. MWU12-2323]MPQ69221.1 hypothetical protein [Pseudomonas sp. MWU12-2323]
MELATLNDAAAAWASQVIQTIADAKGIAYSTAAAIVEAQPFYLERALVKSMDVQQAANLLMAERSVSLPQMHVELMLDWLDGHHAKRPEFEEVRRLLAEQADTATR